MYIYIHSYIIATAQAGYEEERRAAAEQMLAAWCASPRAGGLADAMVPARSPDTLPVHSAGHHSRSPPYCGTVNSAGHHSSSLYSNSRFPIEATRSPDALPAHSVGHHSSSPYNSLRSPMEATHSAGHHSSSPPYCGTGNLAGHHSSSPYSSSRSAMEATHSAGHHSSSPYTRVDPSPPARSPDTLPVHSAGHHSSFPSYATYDGSAEAARSADATHSAGRHSSSPYSGSRSPPYCGTAENTHSAGRHSSSPPYATYDGSADLAHSVGATHSARHHSRSPYISSRSPPYCGTAEAAPPAAHSTNSSPRSSTRERGAAVLIALDNASPPSRS